MIKDGDNFIGKWTKDEWIKMKREEQKYLVDFMCNVDDTIEDESKTDSEKIEEIKLHIIERGKKAREYYMKYIKE